MGEGRRRFPSPPETRGVRPSRPRRLPRGGPTASEGSAHPGLPARPARSSGEGAGAGLAWGDSGRRGAARRPRARGRRARPSRNALLCPEATEPAAFFARRSGGRDQGPHLLPIAASAHEALSLPPFLPPRDGSPWSPPELTCSLPSARLGSGAELRPPTRARPDPAPQAPRAWRLQVTSAPARRDRVCHRPHLPTLSGSPVHLRLLPPPPPGHPQGSWEALSRGDSPPASEGSSVLSRAASCLS